MSYIYFLLKRSNNGEKSSIVNAILSNSPALALNMRKLSKKRISHGEKKIQTRGENARGYKSAIYKTERCLPFCPAHLRAIIIESRFQTDKRSRKRDRASTLLLTRRERQGNIARGVQRTLIIREWKGHNVDRARWTGRRKVERWVLTMTGEGVGEGW